MKNQLDHDTIEHIGVWLLRIVLAAGAAYCGVHDKTDAATTLALVLFFSFFLL